MAVGDLVTVRIVTNAASTAALSTLGFKFLTIGASASGLVSRLVTNGDLADFMKGKGTDVAIQQVQVVDVVPGTGATYATTPSPTIAGDDASASDYLPPQCCVVNTWYTALKGRAYRGRLYHVGYRENHNVSGEVDATTRTKIGDFCSALITTYGAGGTDADYQLVVISRFLDNVARPTPIGTPVTGYAVRSVFNTQRRRVAGVGL